MLEGHKQALHAKVIDRLKTKEAVSVERHLLFTKPENFLLIQFKAFADNTINVLQAMISIFHKVENLVRKCWLSAFSPFPTIFSSTVLLKLEIVW